MEGIEIITKPNPVLEIVFAVSIIANTVNTEFGFVPLIQAEKQLQRSAFHDFLRKQWSPQFASLFFHLPQLMSEMPTNQEMLCDLRMEIC